MQITATASGTQAMATKAAPPETPQTKMLDTETPVSYRLRSNLSSQTSPELLKRSSTTLAASQRITSRNKPCHDNRPGATDRQGFKTIREYFFSLRKAPVRKIGGNIPTPSTEDVKATLHVQGLISGNDEFDYFDYDMFAYSRSRPIPRRQNPREYANVVFPATLHPSPVESPPLARRKHHGTAHAQRGNLTSSMDAANRNLSQPPRDFPGIQRSQSDLFLVQPDDVSPTSESNGAMSPSRAELVSKLQKNSMKLSKWSRSRSTMDLSTRKSLEVLPA